MMALTHALVSVAVASALLPLGPEYATPPLLAAALLGGVLPDLDVFAAHRKTLHYPVYR
ncbi:metal-dependent hydrolase [Halobellus sp. Atlit-31R]|nr:metal-dependent hydrolase [Halobellus sp. Atlit-31R]